MTTSRALLAVAVALGTAVADSAPIPLELRDEADVARVVLSARRRVLVLAPSLRSRTVADALRRLAVEGGVPVLILADASLVGERSSLMPALSLLRERGHPVEVRLLSGVSRAVLVSDDERVAMGPLVAEPATFGLKPTRLVLDRSEGRRQADHFLAQWRRGKPWSFRAASPAFVAGGRNRR